MCNWIVWIIIGAIAGWLASIVMKTNKEQGLIMDIIVGVIGGFIGGWVLDLLGLNNTIGDIGLGLGSIITATIGAVILLAVLRYLRNRN